MLVLLLLIESNSQWIWKVKVILGKPVTVYRGKNLGQVICRSLIIVISMLCGRCVSSLMYRLI